MDSDSDRREFALLLAKAVRVCLQAGVKQRCLVAKELVSNSPKWTNGLLVVETDGSLAGFREPWSSVV